MQYDVFFLATSCNLHCVAVMDVMGFHRFHMGTHMGTVSKMCRDVPCAVMCRVLFLTGFRFDACCHCL